MDVGVAGYRLIEPVSGGGGASAGGSSLPVAGGPAVVWRGTRAADAVPVAVKLFHPADAARAHREADLAAAVGHSHVLGPLEVVTAPGAVALILPWADGGSLASLLSERHRVRWTETLTVLIPLADALAAAHERGVVHGDLSAGNVLLMADGRPMLGDLGAARAAAEMGGAVAVTPTDVAPEIARGGVPSPASDLFSLGSVALRCLSGRPAWPAGDLQDVLIQATAGQWPDPEDLMGPPALLAIVRRLLDPDPARRGSAAQAAVELRRVGDPEPVELLALRSDGSVGVPAPATVVRPDALRPPGSVAAWRRPRAHRRAERRRRRPVRPARGALRSGRHHRARRRERREAVTKDPIRPPWRARAVRDTAGTPDGPEPAAGALRGAPGGTPGHGRHGWPMIVAAAVVLLLGAGAVRVGLWWADSSGGLPVAAPPVTGGQASGVPAARGGAAGSPVPAGPSSWPAVSGASAPQESAAMPPDRTWLAVVSTLDAARAAAFVARDARLLDEVYTADAPARAADERQISSMTNAGYWVAAAGHHVQSVTVIGISDHGTVTVRVVESLPSYPILDDAGTVVGRSSAVQTSAVDLILRSTGDGFRISTVTRG